MSTHPNTQPSGLLSRPDIEWAQPERAAAFHQWLQSLEQAHGVLPATVRAASADASFRRYFRVDLAAGSAAASCVIMDAPPDQENCEPFVRIAQLMQDAGLNVPRILAWDAPQGFMLLDDIGQQTMMDVIDPAQPQVNNALFVRALDALLSLQQSSRPGVLPAYDEALLKRELSLFPDWYLTQHRQLQLDSTQRDMLGKAFETIVQRNLAAPSVFVHRDFMPRNLMMPHEPAEPHRGEAVEPRLGVLDFQDAVYGPITYDIASLMRDAFLTWDEDFVLDITIRYWERARQLGLMDFEDWHSDFGAFYRAVEWMGLQRHLKVAGIFARLTLRDGKPKYLADAPRFIHYIRSTASRYSELTPLLRLIDKVEGTEPAISLAFPRLTPGRKV